jgi:hypothetical protein
MKNLALSKIEIVIEAMKEMQKETDFAKVPCSVIEKRLTEIKNLVKQI